MQSSSSADAPGMTSGERRAALALAALFIARMLGLFLLLPVLALYAAELDGATPLLIGLAIGIYGLTQAGLQIPLGWLSDRIGRKPVIVGGLLVFAIGSAIAAVSDHIVLVVLGRALQGAGAIAAAVLALATDLTRESQRTKVMAIIGASIGLAFTLAIALGPLLQSVVGVSGLFWIGAVLAMVGIALVLFVIPSPPAMGAALPGRLADVLALRDLQRLDLGVLILHANMTAVFVVLPGILRDAAGLAQELHWWVYLPALLVSLAAVFPAVMMADRRGHWRPLMLGAIALLAAALLAFSIAPPIAWVLGVVVAVFFTGFNVLEAMMPAQVSRRCPPGARGAAMGVYATSQFFGAFVGAAGSGLAVGLVGAHGVFIIAAVITLIWWWTALGLGDPGSLSRYRLDLTGDSRDNPAEITRRLKAVPGVTDATVIGDEGVAYLTVDRQRLDVRALREVSTAGLTAA